MIGYVITEQLRDAIASALHEAQVGRGLTPYLHLSALPYDGNFFLPLSDSDLEQVMHNGNRLRDFPETQQIIAMLGGLDARIEIELPETEGEE